MKGEQKLTESRTEVEMVENWEGRQEEELGAGDGGMMNDGEVLSKRGPSGVNPPTATSTAAATHYEATRTGGSLSARGCNVGGRGS